MLGNLPLLKELELHVCHNASVASIDSLPAELRRLELLTCLSIDERCMPGLEHLSALQDLGLKCVAANSDAGADVLPQHLPSRLTQLSFDGLDPPDASDEVAHRWQLLFPQQPSDQGLQALVAGASERCPSLQALSMSFQPKLMSSTAGALAAAHLPALKHLSLIKTSVDDADLMCLVCRMTQLRELFMVDCQHITDDGVEAAFAATRAPDGNKLLALKLSFDPW